MRNGRTHDIMTSYAMPNTKKKLIRKINREIDSPGIFYKTFKKKMGLTSPKYRIPGITYYGHRQKAGHDFTDMIYFGAKYGQEGINAWMNHQAQDMISDFIVKRHGSFARNILEDSFLEFSRPKYRKRY